MKKVVCIFGGGEAPKMILSSLKERGIFAIFIPFNEEEEPSSLLKRIKSEGAEEVLLCGRFEKSLLFKKEGLPRDGIRSFAFWVKALFEKEGIRVVPHTEYLRHLLCKEGYLTTPPSGERMEDVRWGIEVAKKIASFGIGHTLVLKDKVVLAVEAAEGSDEAILRGGRFTEDAVIVKVGCKELDWFDIPTVGEQTLLCMKRVGARTIALEAESVLLLEGFLPLAKRLQVSVVGIRCS
jgi:hypothetical protein